MPRLMIRDKDEQSWEVTLSGPVYVGRQRDCDIVLPGVKVSRRHARFLPVGRSYVIEDLGSSNGVFVNDERVERRILRHGDLVGIGDFRVRFIGEPGEDLVGKVVKGYRIIRRIGSGGMGSVYLAEQSSMRRFVALKVLNEELAEDRTFIEDFMNEARLAGRLNHPGIVRVYDFGELEQTYFIAMEYVDGKTLKDRLDEEGKIAPLDLVHIMQAVAAALEHAHGHSIIHQDIKPQNIMITAEGEVKLADLGLARFAGDRVDERHRKVIIGTPHYMSPEQGNRSPADTRSDIYSFGASMFHLVTGRVPFDGANSLAIITKHIHQEPPNPKQFDMTLPDGLVKVILRCLQKDPANRYADARQLSKALAAIEKEVAASAARSRKRREIATGIRPREVARRRIARKAVTTGSPVLWVLLVASVGLLILVYAGVSLVLDGRRGGDGGRDKEVRIILGRAERALDDGAEMSARRHAETVLAMVSEGPLAEGARNILLQLDSNMERAAQRKLALLKNLFSRDPDAAVPFLRGFVNEHSGTDAARVAAEMLAGFASGGARPLGGGSQAALTGMVAQMTPEEAVQRAGEFETSGELARAVAVLRSALRQDPDDAGKQLLGNALEPLLQRSSAKASEILKQVDEALKTGRLARASGFITQGLKVAAQDDDRQALLIRRSRIIEESRNLLEGTAAHLKALLAALELVEVAEEVTMLGRRVGRQNLPPEVAAAGEVATLASIGLNTLVAAITASPGRSAQVSLSGRQPRWMDVKGADAKMVVVAPKGGQDIVLRWEKLDPETLYQVVLAYGGRTKGGAGYAALLAARGNVTGARRIIGDGGLEMVPVERYLSVGEKDKSEQRYVFTGIGDLGAWAVEKGDWRLADGAIEEYSGGEAVIALRSTVKLSRGLLRVEERVVLGQGAGFAALRLEAPEGVKAVLYLDSEGGRFEVRSAAVEKVFRIEKTIKSGEAATLVISVERGKVRAWLGEDAFPEVEVFGAEALAYKLALEGMGRKFSVKEVVVSGR